MNKLLLIGAILGGLVLLAVMIVPWLLPRPGLIGEIPEQPFSDSRFAEIAGVRLHHRARQLDVGSEKPLVILLHGFASSTFAWRHTLDALGHNGHPVVAVDLPPFGYSERNGAGSDWPDLIIGLSDTLAPDRTWIVVGHSMGAAVAAEMAARRPDQVAELVFVAGTPGMNRRINRLGLWATRIPSVARAMEVLIAHHAITEDNVFELLQSAYGREPSTEEFEHYYRPLSIPGTYPALIRRLADRPREPDESWQTKPVTVIWGEQDQWVPLRVGQDFLEHHPDARFILMESVGHNPMETHPSEFNRHLFERLHHGLSQ